MRSDNGVRDSSMGPFEIAFSAVKANRSKWFARPSLLVHRIAALQGSLGPLDFLFLLDLKLGSMISSFYDP